MQIVTYNPGDGDGAICLEKITESKAWEGLYTVYDEEYINNFLNLESRSASIRNYWSGGSKLMICTEHNDVVTARTCIGVSYVGDITCEIEIFMNGLEYYIFPQTSLCISRPSFSVTNKAAATFLRKKDLLLLSIKYPEINYIRNIFDLSEKHVVKKAKKWCYQDIGRLQNPRNILRNKIMVTDTDRQRIYIVL